MTHAFVNSDPSGFDSNCSVCDGKQRDAVHADPIYIDTAYEIAYSRNAATTGTFAPRFATLDSRQAKEPTARSLATGRN